MSASDYDDFRYRKFGDMRFRPIGESAARVKKKMEFRNMMTKEKCYLGKYFARFDGENIEIWGRAEELFLVALDLDECIKFRNFISRCFMFKAGAEAPPLDQEPLPPIVEKDWPLPKPEDL